MTDRKILVDDFKRAVLAMFVKIARSDDPDFSGIDRTLCIEALALAAALHCGCDDDMTDDTTFIRLAKTTIAEVRGDLEKQLS